MAIRFDIQAIEFVHTGTRRRIIAAFVIEPQGATPIVIKEYLHTAHPLDTAIADAAVEVGHLLRQMADQADEFAKQRRAAAAASGAP